MNLYSENKKISKKIFKKDQSLSKQHYQFLNKSYQLTNGNFNVFEPNFSIFQNSEKKSNQIAIRNIEQISLPEQSQNKTIENTNWKLKSTIVSHEGWVNCIDIDPSNDFFATGSNDNLIRFWDVATHELKLSLLGHVAPVKTLKISHQHTYLFSGSEDRVVSCWDLTTNKQIRKYHGHTSGVYTLSIHPSQNLIASGGRDQTVRLWDIRTKTQIFGMEGHQNSILSLEFQQDEPQLISGSSDCTIKLWDIVAGKKFKTLSLHKKAIRALYPHKIEYSFLSMGSDGLKLWQCPEGQYLRTFQNSQQKNGVNLCLDVNSDDLIVIGTNDGYLKFYDWESGNFLNEIEVKAVKGSLESEKSILALKFDKSGLRLITCGTDKTIKIWEKIDLNQLYQQWREIFQILKKKQLK